MCHALFVFAFYLFVLHTSIYAQEQKPQNPPPRYFYNSFGNLDCVKEKVKLFYFAISIRYERDSKGYIIAYGGKRGKQNEAVSRVTQTKVYLIQVLKFEPERIVIIDGGFRENLAFELFIVPSAMNPPEAKLSIETKNVEFDGKADVVDAPCESYDFIWTRCGTDGYCTSVEFDYRDGGDSKNLLDSLWAELVNAPTKKGHIIVYAGERSKKNEDKFIASRAKDYLVRHRGLPATRVEAIDGGYREKPSLDIWLVPEGKEPPKPTPTLQPNEVKVYRNVKTKKRR
jgi:hypothetical protein